MAKITQKTILSLLESIRYDASAFDPKEGNFDDLFYTDKTYLSYVLWRNGAALEYVSDEYKSDYDLIRIAGEAGFEFASASAKEDKEFILEMIGKDNFGILTHISKKLLLDKDLLSQFDDEDLRYLIDEEGPEELRNDKEFVLRTIKYNGTGIQYLCNEFKNDYDIALAAVSNNSYAYEYISDELKNNRKIFLATKGGDHLAYASEEFRADKELVSYAVQRDGGALEYAADTLKADKDVVTKAIMSRSNINDALEVVAPELLADKEFVTQLLFIDGDVFSYISKDLQKDSDIKLLYKIVTS